MTPIFPPVISGNKCLLSDLEKESATVNVAKGVTSLFKATLSSLLEKADHRSDDLSYFDFDPFVGNERDYEMVVTCVR